MDAAGPPSVAFNLAEHLLDQYVHHIVAVHFLILPAARSSGRNFRATKRPRSVSLSFVYDNHPSAAQFLDEAVA